MQCDCFKLLYLWQSAAEVFISEYETLYPVVDTRAISFHVTSLHPISTESCLAIFPHILDLQNGCIIKIFPHNIAVTCLEMLLYTYNVL
jgi:hypothetical protein